MDDQADFFEDPKPTPAAWKRVDAVESGRSQKKPWAQRRQEFQEYNTANPGVLEHLAAISKEAVDRRVRGDAQRLYVDFNERFCDGDIRRFPKFPREYITFYVRKIMFEYKYLRGYYRVKRQDGEPDRQWNLCRGWHDEWRKKHVKV